MVDKNSIPDYCGQDFGIYYEKVKKDFENVKQEFPLLQITLLPTVKPKEIYIRGLLINKRLIEVCSKTVDIKRRSIEILAIYPSDFPNSEIVVEDLRGKIKWSEIPKEHRHRNKYKNGREVLCTHHPNGEINEIPFEKRTIMILNSAWNLYYQYKSYLKSRNWTLQDLPHGIEGDKQLKQEKRFYEK